VDPINTLSTEQARRVRVVFTDIDDTLSTEGKILAPAYTALWRLHDAGIPVVPITGRAAGWVDHIARMWPVAGVVGENGAFYAYIDQAATPPKLRKRYYLRPEEVHQAQQAFEHIKAEVFARFPTAAVASDQPYREFDLAIDFCEDVPPLALEEVQEIVGIYERHGARTKVSSIHVNGWFGEYDKLTMTRLFASERLGFSVDEHPDWALFIGDSPNDQPMFEFFPASVAVANIARFLPYISVPPAYVTGHPGGLGFAEMVEVLLRLRE
jgi:HAD superfamily hydrolase (TIGR01484 family)